MKKTLTQISRSCRPVVGEMLNLRINVIMAAIVVIVTTLAAPLARATNPFVVNFQLLAWDGGAYGSGATPPALYSGAGANFLGSSGTYWNGINCSAATNYNTGVCTNTASLADDGTTVTGVRFSESGAFGYQAGTANTLLDHYLDIQSPKNGPTAPPTPFYLTNLPSGLYNIVVYSVEGIYYNDPGTVFTITNDTVAVSQTCHDTYGSGIGDSGYALGQNCLIFSNIVVNSGIIRGAFGPAGYSASKKIDSAFNGVQLQYLGTNIAPLIVTNPASRTAVQGSAATFIVAAAGYPVPLSYRWQFSPDNVTFTNLINGASVSGATSNVLTLPHVAVNQAGYYQVVVTNSAGSATSISVQLTVNTLAAPWTVNFDFDNYAGGFVGTYSAAGVEGSGTYWNSIDGGGSFDAGNFYSTGGLLDNGSTDSGVTATVNAGGAYSFNPVNNALLDDYAFTKSGAYALTFANLPDGVYDVVLFGTPGGNATNLTTGTTFTFNGQSLSDTNTTDASFIQSDNYVRYPTMLVQGGTLSGTYAPAAGKTEGDFCGAQLRYLGATNSVLVAPTIVAQPASQTNFQNFPATLQVVANGYPLNYQWQSGASPAGPFANLANNNNVSGVQSPNLQITNLQATASYRVVITNSSGSVTGSVATLTVNALATPWTVNFDYNNTFGGSAGNYNNYGAIGSGKYWNPITGPTNFQYPAAVFTSVGGYGYTDDGMNNLAIGLSVTDGGGFSSTPAVNALLDDFAATYRTYEGAQPFAFTNLPDGFYNLVLYGVNGQAHNGATKFTVNGQSLSCTNTTDANFILGDNYAVFNNVRPTNGVLAGTYDAALANGTGYFNGAQLQYLGATNNGVAAPVIVTQPVSQTNSAGFPVQFVVVASGGYQLAYQWQSAPLVSGPFTGLINDANTAGAQGPVLSLAHASANNYRVVITNAAGSVTSSVVTLTASALTTPWTVNFDFDNTAGAVSGGFTNYSTYVGYGVLGSGSTHSWNSIYGPTNDALGTYLSYSGFTDDGLVNTPIRCNVTGYADSFINPANGLKFLMDDYAVAYQAEPFTFSGLPDGYYHLALFGVNGGYHNGGTAFRVSGQTLMTSNTLDTLFTQGNNYVLFTNVLVQGGVLVGYFSPNTNVLSNTMGEFCGAQLQYVGSALGTPLFYTPTVTLNLQAGVGGQLIMQWSQGTLQTNANLSNPSGWGAVTGATSPYTNSTPNLPQLFYRVLVQ